MSVRKKAACAMVALSLAACQQGAGGFDLNAETVGTLGGAAGGALIGSQFGGGSGRIATTALGGVLGALAGREIARAMQGDDPNYAATAEQRAVAQNEEITWNNPETGNRGVIEPVRTYRDQSGQLCREYVHTVYIEGRAETARGTACLEPDGTWRLVS